MKTIKKISITLLCILVITTSAISYVSKNRNVFGGEIDVHGSVVTRAIMGQIGLHMAEIMDAILKGDSATVTKEAKKIAEISGSIMNEFFPKDGQVGRKFKVSDKSMKEKFEKFVQIIFDNSRNMVATSKEGDLSGAYESFDDLFRNACLACHKTTRDDWLDLVP
ncbi:enoyl-CoA hydratase/carnithine racemase [Candidatus Scalindua japonica]|uniref:Enoyl-CoA hydratase/carnithine racemase n=1 Tax=Candidatus Scalindua japonica TaxID=1284222 RepID=A0A286TXU2_9BACT|nr:cytochrome c [Candidatus Scalindua japonica]GAX60700.1 enoyl-CoA hydratase/carnithine racemase [Candidatus Scalindua japonica]